MKRNIAWLSIIALTYLMTVLTGCGGGGSTTASGGGGGGGGGGTTVTLPTDPAGQISYSVDKLKDANYASAKTGFDAAKNNSNSTDYQKREAATGSLYCDVKLGNLDLGSDSLVNSLLQITNKNSTTFAPEYAVTAEVRIPLDAHLLLGIAYMVRNKSGDNDKAVSSLQQLGGSTFNANFTFNTEIGLSVTNPEAHALLSMAFFYAGNKDSSSSQLAIAKTLDADGQYLMVSEISNALAIMGL
ncbi:MAG: hypothetical protein PHW04_01765 [Candidatus Wallbacteria bacterium]|nr:hypothetical protein [Candidatus Wallbacteria bacterium]